MASSDQSPRKILNKIVRSTAKSALYDPRHGMQPFQMETMARAIGVFEPPRTNYFTLYWIESGAGLFWADTAQHAFQSDQLLCFLPYQHCRFELRKPLRGTVLRFHANFLCVETFHSETGCSGTLFNDPYGQPLVEVADAERSDIQELLARLQREQECQQLGFQDAQLACLKLLLIVATRLKAVPPSSDVPASGYRHPVIETLRGLIETHYQTMHAPSDYAALMHMTIKSLGRCVREQLGKTLTELVRERILTHAKWQLLHTLRPVKEIAVEIGFHDELYFSRLFKKATGVSPTFFREFETEIRGGSNLSMTSSHAPILPVVDSADHTSISVRRSKVIVRK